MKFHYDISRSYLYRSLVDKTVTSVELKKADMKDVVDDTLIFHTDDGDVVWYVDSECCSHTWIEHWDFGVFGGKILDVREDGLPDEHYKAYPEEEQDCLRLYGITIQSEKGTGTIDFRNESNGYYGGSMEVLDGDGRRWRG